MFPEPREQAKAIGVYGFVASAGGSIGLLAGGVLTQAINWHWIFFINLPVGVVTAFSRRAAGRRPPGDRPAGRRRPPRRGAAHERADARRLHHPAGRRAGLGFGADARARRRRGRPAGRVRRAPGPHRQPADAAAPLPLAQRLRRERRHRAARRRDVRDVLPRRAVPAAHRGLRPAAGRPGLPALDRRHGHDVAARLRTARTCASAPRRRSIASLVSIGAGLLLFSRTPVDGDLRDRHHARDDPDRHRRRARLPVADDARDVGRHARATRGWPRA